MRFVLTGFGKFLGVDDNPTMHLVEALSTREDVLLSSVLKVAGIDAERFVAEAFASPLVASDGPPVCFLHLGVAARRDCICLERTALNCADFRCPDERGWMPSMEPIRPEDGSHEKRITTQFDVDDLCAKMVAQKFPVAVSEDAGFPLSLFSFSFPLTMVHQANFYAIISRTFPAVERISRSGRFTPSLFMYPCLRPSRKMSRLLLLLP